METHELMYNLGIDSQLNAAEGIQSLSPINGSVLGSVEELKIELVDEYVQKSQAAFYKWRKVPAPRRGELVRILGEKLRDKKELLGRLVSVENGKILSEGLGEVQEMIDICDLAVGLSRQLYGLTIASERPGHSMRETWHPLGVNCIITAFNFPVAVWAWNSTLALVCGNSVIWKPSEKTPLTALAVQQIFIEAAEEFGPAPDDLSLLAIGGVEVGEALVTNKRVALVSATGSTAMGKKVGNKVASRFGKSLLELDGNNAMIVTPSADLDLALPAIVFSAVGTAGQRCTTLRRLIVHENIYDLLLRKLKNSYLSLKIGSPLDTTAPPNGHGLSSSVESSTKPASADTKSHSLM